MPEHKIDVSQERPDEAYFVMTQQIAWALCRHPYDLALWTVVKMIAGEGKCTLSAEDLAGLSMMSVGKALDCRLYLITAGLLSGQQKNVRSTWRLRIPSIWRQNIGWREMNHPLKGEEGRIALKLALRKLFKYYDLLTKFNVARWQDSPLSWISASDWQNINVARLVALSSRYEDGVLLSSQDEDVSSQDEDVSSQDEAKKNPEVKPEVKPEEAVQPLDLMLSSMATEQKGVAEPGWFDHFGYRDEALKAYEENAGTSWLNQAPARKTAIIDYAAEEGFSMEAWKLAVSTVITGAASPGNVDLMIEVARSGKTYKHFLRSQQGRNGSHIPVLTPQKNKRPVVIHDNAQKLYDQMTGESHEGESSG